VQLNVDISRDLDLLDALRAQLVGFGMRAEMREHLIGLVVFASPPALPVRVFVSQGGRFFSWQSGEERHPVTDARGAAERLAAFVEQDLASLPATRCAETTQGLTGLTETGELGGGAMTECASDSLRKMTSASSWKCSRNFAGKPDQVREARAFLRRVLEGCPVTDDAVLLMSEIAANAVLHSKSRMPHGQFTVHAEAYEGEYLWVEVEDEGGPWKIKGARIDGRGHGLEIVETIADDWGRDGDPDTGWAVWFRLDWNTS
jgi:anti-sigma regulatory factor (Ser/Thr protein kinase)